MTEKPNCINCGERYTVCAAQGWRGLRCCKTCNHAAVTDTQGPTFEITDWDWQPPDHPWSPELAVEEWCGICGAPEIVHDGNLERAFDWMEAAP